MASLYIADAVRNLSVPSLSFSSIILYVVVAMILVCIVAMLLGTSFDIKMIDFRPKRMQVLSKGSVFWKTKPLSGKLIVSEDEIDPFFTDRYTCLVDIVLKNTRPRMGGNIYRHLFHRGSEDLVPSTLPAYGLPKRMNPGVFLDPNVNDVLVYVDTVQNGVTFRESVRIADIPLDIPFRLGILVQGRLLEVYINCKLEVTKMLDGEPKDVENAWYGVLGSAAAEAQVQHLTIWTKPLSVEELSPLCPAAIPEFGAAPACKVNLPGMDGNGMEMKLVDKALCALDTKSGVNMVRDTLSKGLHRE